MNRYSSSFSLFQAETRNLIQLGLSLGLDGDEIGRIIDQTLQETINHQEIPTVGKKVGFGSFSHVYTGVWKGLPVALKAVKHGVEAEEHFENECELMKKLDHPNLLKLYGTSQAWCHDLSKMLTFMILEFMPYGDLLQFLRTNWLHNNELFSFSLQAAQGMVYLHSQNIIHRDLACRNLLVGRDHSIKISDFGFSCEIHDDECIYCLQNKLIPVRWSAPESLQCRCFSKKSDVWSFGVTLWEIFTNGGTPFPDLNNTDVIQNVVHQKQSLKLPKISELNSLLQNCFNYEASLRPSFEEVLNRLQNFSQPQMDPNSPLSRAVTPETSLGLARLFHGDHYDPDDDEQPVMINETRTLTPFGPSSSPSSRANSPVVRVRHETPHPLFHLENPHLRRETPHPFFRRETPHPVFHHENSHPPHQHLPFSTSLSSHSSPLMRQHSSPNLLGNRGSHQPIFDSIPVPPAPPPLTRSGLSRSDSTLPVPVDKSDVSSHLESSFSSESSNQGLRRVLSDVSASTGSHSVLTRTNSLGTSHSLLTGFQRSSSSSSLPNAPLPQVELQKNDEDHSFAYAFSASSPIHETPSGFTRCRSDSFTIAHSPVPHSIRRVESVGSYLTSGDAEDSINHFMTLQLQRQSKSENENYDESQNENYDESENENYDERENENEIKNQKKNENSTSRRWFSRSMPLQPITIDFDFEMTNQTPQGEM